MRSAKFKSSDIDRIAFKNYNLFIYLPSGTIKIDQDLLLICFVLKKIFFKATWIVCSEAHTTGFLNIGTIDIL